MLGIGCKSLIYSKDLELRYTYLLRSIIIMYMHVERVPMLSTNNMCRVSLSHSIGNNITLEHEENHVRQENHIRPFPGPDRPSRSAPINLSLLWRTAPLMRVNGFKLPQGSPFEFQIDLDDRVVIVGSQRRANFPPASFLNSLPTRSGYQTQGGFRYIYAHRRR